MVNGAKTLRRCAVALSLIAVFLGAAPRAHATAMRGSGESSEGYHHSEPHRTPGNDRHREGDHDGNHMGVRPRIYWLYPYNYATAPPLYWYYCESYGVYYPYVRTCPESWIPVPAS